MPEVRIGSIVVTVEGETLSLRSDGPDAVVRLEGDGVRDLLAFLRRNDLGPGNQRRSFRVPLAPARRPSVILRNGDAVHVVTALDLSVIGIQIACAADAAPDLCIGAAVRLTLAFGEDAWEVPAIVRWRDGRRYGLEFPYAFDGDDVRPPGWLATLVAELERRWMTERLASFRVGLRQSGQPSHRLLFATTMGD